MALKLGSPTSVASDISVSIKPNNNNNVKNVDIISVGLLHQYKYSCSLKRIRIASPPIVAAFKAESQEPPDESSESQGSVKLQLDLLERLTSNNTVNLEGNGQTQNSSKMTIREQLSELVNGDVDETIIPLGKRFKPKNVNSLTMSQKRNIRRQDYLDKVSQRNDIPFFTTIALFVIVPPIVILGVAVATGYVDLLP